MVRSFLLFAAVLLWAGCALQAQKAVPEAVKTTFNEKFPKAGDVDWKLEADGNWEVEFELDDEESSATFTAEGKWLETETEIAVDDLPDAVRKAVQGQKVKEAARILKADGTTVYEVEIGKKDLIYDAAGQLLMEEKD